MIQRIQSVYLLLVTVLLVVAICMPVGQFIGADGVTAHVFKPLGVALADGGFQSTWGLFGILLLSALVAFCTIFLFRNRMLQIRRRGIMQKRMRRVPLNTCKERRAIPSIWTEKH